LAQTDGRLTPIFGLGLGALLLGERVVPLDAGELAAVALGIALVQWPRRPGESLRSSVPGRCSIPDAEHVVWPRVTELALSFIPDVAREGACPPPLHPARSPISTSSSARGTSRTAASSSGGRSFPSGMSSPPPTTSRSCWEGWSTSTRTTTRRAASPGSA